MMLVLAAWFKKYWRWLFLGLFLALLAVAWILIAANSGLRQRLEATMLQLVVSNKISDLRDKAAAIQAQLGSDEQASADAQKQVQLLQQQIEANKESLKKGLSDRGLSAEEIADRLNNL